MVTWETRNHRVHLKKLQGPDVKFIAGVQRNGGISLKMIEKLKKVNKSELYGKQKFYFQFSLEN